MAVVYEASEIYRMSEEQIWSLPDERLTIDFVDGTMDVSTRGTILSWYLGKMHRQYPNTPIYKSHHIANRIVSKDLLRDVVSQVAFDIIDFIADGRKITKILDELGSLAFSINEDVYEMIHTRLGSHVSTISVLDFVNVLEHPVIKEANETVKPTQNSIDRTYEKISGTLNTMGDELLVGNTISKMAKSGLVSMGQIQQCVGPRGYLTDIDSNIFKEPVLGSYGRGIISLQDSMKESRSAAKALKFSSDKVSKTEYFSRELQLMSSVVTRLHRGDCGSERYVKINVEANDLSNIVGKYYLDETEGTLKEIKSDDRHLIGKTIKMRSALKCNHPDHYGVCSTCFGKLADSIPSQTNIGAVSATVLGEKITQNVLSTKHLDGSSKVDGVEFTEYEAQFITAMDEVVEVGNGVESTTVIKLNPKVCKARSLAILIDPDQAKNLPDIDYHNLDNITPAVISSIREIMLEVEFEKDIYQRFTLPVSMGSRLSWLTREALEFIQKNGYKINDDGKYHINLTGWDSSIALFQLPLKQTDMTQFMTQIKSFVTKPKNGKKAIKNPDEFLVGLYNLITSKIKINIAHLEVIVLASLVEDIAEGNYRLPGPNKDGEILPFRENLWARSLGAPMAYQGQGNKIMEPATFLQKGRADSPYDNLLFPLPNHNPKD